MLTLRPCVYCAGLTWRRTIRDEPAHDVCERRVLLSEQFRVPARAGVSR